MVVNQLGEATGFNETAEDEEGKAFDPARHVRDLGGNEYLDVKWRVVWFRRDHPLGIIETELIAHERTPDMKDAFALFRCKVIVPGKAPGQTSVHVTGWGSETKQDFRDYIEKAETKALGRALAHMGYGTASLPDDGDRIADAPVERARPRDADPPLERVRTMTGAGGTLSGQPPAAHHTIRQPSKPATAKQVDLITRTCARKNVTVEALEQYVEQTYHLDLADLTMGAASDIIGKLLDDTFKGFDLAPAGPEPSASDGDRDELEDARF